MRREAPTSHHSVLGRTLDRVDIRYPLIVDVSDPLEFLEGLAWAQRAVRETLAYMRIRKERGQCAHSRMDLCQSPDDHGSPQHHDDGRGDDPQRARRPRRDGPVHDRANASEAHLPRDRRDPGSSDKSGFGAES